MKKKAINKSTILRALGGAAAGGAVGYHATPHMFGYADVPEARRSSAVLDATLGGVAGGMGLKNLKLLMASPKRMTPKNIWPTLARQSAPVTAGLAAESIPIAQSTMHKQRESAHEATVAARHTSEAAKQIAEAGKTVSIPHGIREALRSPTARGAGVGAAGAGLLALVSGLNRKMTSRDLRNRTTRTAMVKEDLMKYLLPAMVAGGVAGSLRNK